MSNATNHSSKREDVRSTEIAALRSELAALTARLDGLLGDATTGEPLTEPDPSAEAPVIEIPDALTRRNWMKAAAAVAVGGTAVALGSSDPVAAANGDPIKLGMTNNVAANSTIMEHTGSGATSFLVKTNTTFTGAVSSFPAALGGWTGSSARPNGVYGFTTVDAEGAAGVVGSSPASRAVGVRAQNTASGGTALQADAPGNGGAAVVASGGYAGVMAAGNRYGVVASGQIAALHLEPSNTDAPPDRSDGQPGGALDVQLLSDSGAASLWFCSAPGAPGVWQKLAGPATAGAFHAIAPIRVYDSRAAIPAPGRLSSGSMRIVSVADARDPVTGAVTGGGAIPAGATAVAYNLTLDATTDSGFLSVNPGNVVVSPASSINWSSSGLIIANAGVVGLDPTRQVKVFCAGGGSTHFVIDITGYYR